MKQKKSKNRKDFLIYLKERIQFLKECERFGTAANYQRAKNSLELYLDGKKLWFTGVKSSLVEGYDEWLQKRGLKRNTISFYMRILRAVFNKGVRMGFCKQTFPFKNVYTGIDKTRKRCVSDQILLQIKALSIVNNARLDLARDVFLFSVYTRGMTFVDIAHLKQKNIKEGSIFYERKKTGQKLNVKIESQTNKLIEKYKKDDDPESYLFPLLFRDDYKGYIKAICAYNYRLRLLSSLLGEGINLTSYTSRHTWASLAYKYDIPVSIISEGMGHTSEKTTRIYLDSLDSTKIDTANRLLLKKIGL